MEEELEKEIDIPKKNFKDKFKTIKIIIEKVKIPFLLFMIYSILGWLLEIVIFLFNEHKFVNRGFLIGPYCPIYGYGCLIVTYGLKRYRKEPIKLFFISVILCTIFEYIVSYAMEVIFGGRWWDYSLNTLNINGRVWLITSLLFGFLVCLIIYYLRPFLIKCIRKIPRKINSFIATFFLLVFITDNIISLTMVLNLKDKIRDFEIDCTNQVSEYFMQQVKNVMK